MSGSFKPHHAPVPDDDVSLRDLYLVFVRGLPVILAVALLAGLGAFLAATVQPDRYEAEAVVTSRQPSVRFREDPTVLLRADEDDASGTFAVEQPGGLAFEAYRAIALGRDVFENARDALGEAAPTYGAYRGSAEVDAAGASAPSGQRTPLLARHRVTWTDPDTAAAYANAWADATVDAVRAALVADLEPTLQITRAAVQSRREALEDAENALRAVATDANGPASDLQRTRLEREVAEARSAYATVAELEPTLTYLAELTPTGTRLLEPAMPPTRSTGASTTLITALAIVLGGLFATLFVFLREAVREPPAAREETPGRRSRTEERSGA